MSADLARGGRSPVTTTTTAAPFNLRALIREVCRTSTLADPGALTIEVFKRIPGRHRDAALRQALRAVVRQVGTEERSRTTISDGAPQLPVTGASAKVAAIRDWARSLRDRVHVGSGEWKFLADCTYGDLLFAAEERREHARRNAAKARQYQALAGLLTEHGAATVRALPIDVQARALGAAA